jgi:predicted transcriptional regulator
MFCGQLISPQVRPLTPTDTVGEALERMGALGLRQLPLTVGDRLSRIVWEEDLLDRPEHDPLGDQGPPMPSVSVHEGDPFLSAVRICQETSLDMVPVLDAVDVYIGVVTREALFPELSRLCGASDPGALIVLGVSPSDYSLSEINRIVESSDAIITHLNTVPGTGGQSMHVYLRLNRSDVASVLAGFRRHEYEVLHQPGGDLFHEELRSNLEHLMTYLNI